MPLHIATAPGRPDHPNEDFAAATATAAVLLDGVSAPVGRDNGCSHGVSWHTRRVGALLLAGLDAGADPRAALAEAITTVASLHAGTCDLGVQETPSATVVAARIGADRLEYLVLSDSVLLTEADGGVRVLADTRLDDLRPRVAPGSVHTWRNVPGGFWTAGSDPRAAEEAVVGTVPPGPFLAMTDGASRAVEVFGDLDWEGAFALVRERGPGALVRRVRELESNDPACRRFPRGKVRDDVTALWWSP
ncbi:hypothetical protein [Nocardiopsis sp. NPDC006938]|uniref:hypothetical protein n=1 Tax=Nocardiopsis sp. NPDC006938 TaxID=3364337 RepID=UPI0036A6FAD8